MNDREKNLLAAAKIVLAGLCLRIENADSRAVPVFNGIADLHDAIAAYEPSPVTSDPGFDGRDGGRMNVNSIGGE